MSQELSHQFFYCVRCLPVNVKADFLKGNTVLLAVRRPGQFAHNDTVMLSTSGSFQLFESSVNCKHNMVLIYVAICFLLLPTNSHGSSGNARCRPMNIPAPSILIQSTPILLYHHLLQLSFPWIDLRKKKKILGTNLHKATRNSCLLFLTVDVLQKHIIYCTYSSNLKTGVPLSGSASML